MKVRFLKDHLENKKGDVIEVDAERANYWKLVGVAEAAKEKNEVIHTKEKNSSAGPVSKKAITKTAKKK